jgi:hypothetical protein
MVVLHRFSTLKHTLLEREPTPNKCEFLRIAVCIPYVTAIQPLSLSLMDTSHLVFGPSHVPHLVEPSYMYAKGALKRGRNSHKMDGLRGFVFSHSKTFSMSDTKEVLSSQPQVRFLPTISSTEYPIIFSKKFLEGHCSDESRR